MPRATDTNVAGSHSSSGSAHGRSRKFGCPAAGTSWIFIWNPSDSIAAAMEVQGIHHLGVAVDDLDAAVDTYARFFGASVEHRDTVREQGVEAASLRVGASRVELLASLGDE